MKIRIGTALITVLLAATMALGQEQNPIEYKPVDCVLPEELSVLQLNVTIPGEIRAYFRFVNTTEWCWVRGSNFKEASTVVLPKFHSGQEIEYFFVVLEGKRVIAKSPVLYRVKTADRCDTLIARHSTDFVVDCSHEVSGSANSFLAGNSIHTTPNHPPSVSPDRPNNQQ